MRGKNLNCGIRGGLWDEVHLERMGPAVWLFGWLVHRQTRERNGVGLVLGGSALTYGMIQGDTGYSRRTLQRWMSDLRRGGYVRVRRTCHSRMIIEVLKAKKFGAKQLGFPQTNFFAPNSSAPIVAQKNAGWTQATHASVRSYGPAATGNRQYKPERQIDTRAHGGNFPPALERGTQQNTTGIFSQASANSPENANDPKNSQGENPGAQSFAANRYENRAEPRAYATSEAFRFRQNARALREAAVRAELRVGAGPDGGGLRSARRKT